MKKALGMITASVVLATSLLGISPEEAEATGYPTFTDADEQRFEDEYGVPMWVDTSDWPARTTYVHRCYERHHVDTLVDQGFGTDNSGNPYTDSAEQGTAAYSVSLRDGLGFGVAENPFPSTSVSTERTAFGDLIDEIRTTSDWDGDPDALKSAAVSASSSADNFNFSETLTTNQKKALERGGVFNVIETKVEGRIAASDNERDLVRVRGYDCGFDYMRTRSNGSIETNTIWFLEENLRERSADPYDSYSLNATEVGMARYNAIQSFSWRDIEHGGMFRRYHDRSGNDMGLREAWRTADCMYSEQIFTNSNQNNPSPSRHRIGADGGYSTPGACGIRSSLRPQISHQMPYAEVGMILRSYRYWDPETEGHHALYQYRAGGSVPTEDNDAHNGIWHNEAPAEFYDIDRMPYSASEPGFDDIDGRYTESEAFSEQFSTHTPHRAYQVMHVVCNPEGAEEVRSQADNGAAAYVHTDQDYSSLLVSTGYDGEDLSGNHDFGRNSGNASEDRDFYTKECAFDPEDVSDGEHAVNNPSNSSAGSERFGSDNPGSNQIAMMRDNIPATVIFDIQENPNISSSHVSNTKPAYTLISKSPESSLGDMMNFTMGIEADNPELFRGTSSSPLYLTNNSSPSSYSSENIDLVDAETVDGFVDRLRVASPWVSESSKPEMFNISYGWDADLMTHIPNAVSVGNTGSGPGDRIRSAEAVRIPIIGRSHIDMGGTGAPSDIADVATTSGSGTNIADKGSAGMDRTSSNSLVFDFIRSVSER